MVYSAYVVPRQLARPAPRRSAVVVISASAKLPEIGGARLSLPAEGVVWRRGVAYFGLDVVPKDAGQAPWRVMRRYSEFHALMQRLQAAKGAVSGTNALEAIAAEFPPKLLGLCWGQRQEERRSKLERWIQEVPLHGSLFDEELTLELRRFLCQGRSAGIAPQGAALPEPSAPPLEAESETELVLLRIALPRGMGGGGQMRVEVPSGDQIEITVPWGLMPGKPLELWYDPVAKTLAVHSVQDWQALCEEPLFLSCVSNPDDHTL